MFSKPIDPKFYDHCLDYFTPKLEKFDTYVTITSITRNGINGIGDNAFILFGDAPNSFEVGQRYFITRSEDNVNTPIAFGAYDKEPVDSYFRMPDSRDYSAWGRVGTIVYFNKDGRDHVPSSVQQGGRSRR